MLKRRFHGYLVHQRRKEKQVWGERHFKSVGEVMEMVCCFDKSEEKRLLGTSAFTFFFTVVTLSERLS